MKSTELQIGDWVYDKVLKSNARVEALQPLTIKCDVHTQKHICDEFEPVKLTPEILEKNGWKEYPQVYWNQKVNFDIYRFEDEVGIKIQGNCIVLKYVHELQRALRICGLNELAENFKID